MSKAKKVLVLGQVSVGKSTLIKNLCGLPIPKNELSTIGLSVKSAIIEGQPSVDKLVFWSVGGQSSVDLVQNDIWVGTSMIIYVFDLTRPSTFQNLKKEISLVKKRMPNMPLLIVGCKKDKVEDEALNELKDALKWAKPMLVSAKSDAARTHILSEVLNKLK